MAWNQSDLELVQAAKLAGAQAKSITFSNGQTITKPSWEYLDKLEQQIRRSLTVSTRPRQYRIYSSRGLD